MNTQRVMFKIIRMTRTIILVGTLPIADHPWVPKKPSKSNLRLAISNKGKNLLTQGMKQGVKTSLRHEKKEFLVNAPTMSEGEITEVMRGVLRDITTKTVHR